MRIDFGWATFFLGNTLDATFLRNSYVTFTVYFVINKV